MDIKPVEILNDPAVLDLETLNLTQHKLIFDGLLTLNLSKDHTVDMHVLLFEDILVFLQKQEERFILKCLNKDAKPELDEDCTYYPVFKLQNVFATTLPTDERLFFVVNSSELESQCYELTAASEELGNKWCNLINDTVEKFKKSLTHTIGINSKGRGSIFPIKIEIFKVIEETSEMMDKLILQEDQILPGKINAIRNSTASADIKSLLESLQHNREKIVAVLRKQQHLLTNCQTVFRDHHLALTSKEAYSAARNDEDDDDDILLITFLFAQAKQLNDMHVKLMASRIVSLQRQMEQAGHSYSFDVPACSPEQFDNTSIADVQMTVEQHIATVSSNLSSLRTQKMDILPECESPLSNRSCEGEGEEHMHHELQKAAMTQSEENVDSLSVSSGLSSILYQ